MIRRSQRSTRTYTHFPDTTLCRSLRQLHEREWAVRHFPFEKLAPYESRADTRTLEKSGGSEDFRLTDTHALQRLAAYPPADVPERAIAAAIVALQEPLGEQWQTWQPDAHPREIGNASCRERGCKTGEIWVVPVTLK